MKALWFFLSFFSLLYSSTQDLERAWLEQNSLLYGANKMAENLEGKKSQWQHPYGYPRPYEAMEKASNWLVVYPYSLIFPSQNSFFSYLGEEKLLSLLQSIGMEGIYLTPIRLSGEVRGNQVYPSSTGEKDPISYLLNPQLGSYDQYLAMTKAAEKKKLSLLGNLLPGQTGKGFDFELALRKYQNYPGLYHLIEIPKKDWHLLPKVPCNEREVSLNPKTIDILQEKGYLVGRLPRNFAFHPDGGVSYWSASDVVIGYDGTPRRWVYLNSSHGKDPILNWLDPSFASQKVVTGSIISALLHEKNTFLKMEMGPFLGIEKNPYASHAFFEGHPLSLTISDLLAQMTRKMGGYSFQDLEVSIPSMKAFLAYGPEFMQDYLLKNAFLHGLLRQNKDLLTLSYSILQKQNLDPVRLIHSLQTSSEFSYEWIDLQENENQTFFFQQKERRSKNIRKILLREDLSLLSNNPYVSLSDKGVSSTLLGLLAACLKIEDINCLSCLDKENLQKLHLLFAFFSCMQPGIFSLSIWDLVGALPFTRQELKELKLSENSPWIGKGSIDLLGKNQNQVCSFAGVPRVKTLYPSIPCQLKDPNSFVSVLKNYLKVRKVYNINQASFLGVVSTQHPSLFAYSLRLKPAGQLALVIINLSSCPIQEEISLMEIQNTTAINLIDRSQETKKLNCPTLCASLQPFEAKILLFQPKVLDSSNL